MLMIMIMLLVLFIAVMTLFWLLMKKQKDLNTDGEMIVQLDKKVDALEANLQKTLGIMQDLAKKMHVQQDVLDSSTRKLHQVEMQNAELVALVAESIKYKQH